MKLVQKIILIIFLSLGFSANAYGKDDSKSDWMNTDITGLSAIMPCIEAPVMTSIHQNSKRLNVEDDDSVWVPTGVYVQQGKMISMLWGTSGISVRPDKYRVLYRIDPRFSNPQIFIQKYDYNQKKYISDFHSYRDAILPFYQDRSEIFSAKRLGDFNDYFKFINRQTINVKKDDVINITLDDTGAFFGSDGQMQNGLGGAVNPPLTIYTDSAGIKNKILYVSAERWCNDIITPSDATFGAKCSMPTKYKNVVDQLSILTGNTSESAFISKLSSIPSCIDNADGNANNPACFYDKGRGFNVVVGSSIIKRATQKFVHSPFTGKDFLYHHADVDGDLNFTTSWPINGMYWNLDKQTMDQWKSFITSGGSDFFNDKDKIDYMRFLTYLNTNSNSSVMNFLHFGVYAMEIEIGKGHATLSDADVNSIDLKYTIVDSGIPNSSSNINAVPKSFKTDAYASGYLFLKVTGASNKSGSINVKIANYTGSAWFSRAINDKVIKPLRGKYNELSEIIYRKLVSNPALQNISRGLLSLYIIIYGLAFLAGAVQITATDLVVRVIKISVIVALFSETSWTFFNDNLFGVFVKGSDYMLTTVVGATSSTGNIFGFIDPIFDRYTDGNLWALLAIQLLQIHNGLTFFSIMTIYSILIYFRGVLEVIISYCLAFLGIAVMISLAPFFILLMLFEKTKSMFDNWLSTLFSYMVQPTILLIFLLLIDQMMGEYITGTVVKACWGTLIPIRIGLDLSTIGMSFFKWTFQLPFFPGIPFYIPVVDGINSAADLMGTGGTFVRIASSSFIFFVYCKLAAGLVDYVPLVVQYLTNVLAARQDGKLQSGQNPIRDIMNDMNKLASPVTAVASGIGGFAKEKFIDQKITHRDRDSTKTDDVNYKKINRKDSDADAGNVAKDDSPEGSDKSSVLPRKKGTARAESSLSDLPPSAAASAKKMSDTKPKLTPSSDALANKLFGQENVGSSPPPTKRKALQQKKSEGGKKQPESSGKVGEVGKKAKAPKKAVGKGEAPKKTKVPRKGPKKK